MREIFDLISPVLYVLAGALGTIGVTWITKHYEEETAYKNMIIATSMDYYKEAQIAARNSGKGYVWPYESFVISISHLVNKVVNKKFKIDDIDGIAEESKRLIKTLDKAYSELDRK